KFMHFYIEELNLHFVAFRADHYEMDLLDIRGQGTVFDDLVSATNQYKVIINGPVFGLDLCVTPSTRKRAIKYLKAIAAAEIPGVDYKGLTKGRLVFRGRPTEVGVCPIPNNPA